MLLNQKKHCVNTIQQGRGINLTLVRTRNLTKCESTVNCITNSFRKISVLINKMPVIVTSSIVFQYKYLISTQNYVYCMIYRFIGELIETLSGCLHIFFKGYLCGLLTDQVNSANPQIYHPCIPFIYIYI